MAEKDPAFLFYSKDFYEGTRLMLPEERACYIDLMIYQQQNGLIPLDLRRVLMYCSGIDEATLKATLEAKFVKTDEGYYNSKLKVVIEKRIEYSSKQSENGILGQFFKKAKQSLTLVKYKELKELIYNDLGKETVIEMLKKEEATHETTLEGLLKHLENAIVINNSNIDYSKLILFFNNTTGKNTKSISEKVKKQINSRLKEGYTKDDIATAIKNCYNDEFHKENNYKYLTLEFITRADKLDKYTSASFKELKQTKANAPNYADFIKA